MNEKCFGLRKGRLCAVLVNGICYGNYANCPFYKPKWKADRDRKAVLYRIALMPLKEQQKISEKYYQGKMPWAKESL